MAVNLKGLKLGGYRGIAEPQAMAPFRRFNFFVGANNSGKSTVLKFLHEQQAAFKDGPTPISIAGSLDAHRGSSDHSLSVGIPLELQEAIEMVQRHLIPISNENSQNFAKRLCELDQIDGYLWARQQKTGTGSFNFFDANNVSKYKSSLVNVDWYYIWRQITGQTGGGLEKHWIPETLSAINSNFHFPTTEVRLIPAIRQVGSTDGHFEGFGGSGIIKKLAELQNPSVLEQEKKEAFRRINHLLQTVLEKPKAYLEIPHDREHIIVHMDNKALPLSSLGTGVEEVILIGAYCTIFDECIWCIEEPELHLHPILQRQLLSYLKEQTSSQYFIATHSAAFMDMPEGAIFHVSNDGSSTKIRNVGARAPRRLLTDELGYRASDIVQSNCVIWVEGPSDRLYLNNWLKQVDENLVEGIDYSVMFYGGRLLSHLSSDAELSDFINLKALNQNTAIIIDSDRDKKGARINKTKQRLKEESDKNAGFCWITGGREIENYLAIDLLEAAIKTKHPQIFGKIIGSTQYDNLLKFKPKTGGKEQTADKVGVARLLCEQQLSLDVLDLRKSVTSLAEYISSANGI